MNTFSHQLLHVACAAFTILSPVYDQEASGAVVSDTAHVVNTTSKNLQSPAGNKGDSVAPDTMDAGYFKLQSETCLPLGPAQQTVLRITGSSHQLSTADAAILSFSWRQIQHYRTEAGPLRKLPQCYYFLF